MIERGRKRKRHSQESGKDERLGQKGNRYEWGEEDEMILINVQMKSGGRGGTFFSFSLLQEFFAINRKGVKSHEPAIERERESKLQMAPRISIH